MNVNPHLAVFHYLALNACATAVCSDHLSEGVTVSQKPQLRQSPVDSSQGPFGTLFRPVFCQQSQPGKIYPSKETPK